jgi:hypothetical protein
MKALLTLTLAVLATAGVPARAMPRTTSLDALWTHSGIGGEPRSGAAQRMRNSERHLREIAMSNTTTKPATWRGSNAAHLAVVTIFAFLIGRISSTFTGSKSDWITLSLNVAVLGTSLHELGKSMRGANASGETA